MTAEKILIRALQKNNMTVSAAESCSAGFLSYLLTKTPGSSNVFKGAVVVYSLEAKNKFFKISLSSLNKTAGVSRKTAAALAKKVRKLFNTDVGLSLVGFAGPSGGKNMKAGTTFVSVADRKGVETQKIVIPGGRDTVRKKAAARLINIAYKRIQKYACCQGS